MSTRTFLSARYSGVGLDHLLVAEDGRQAGVGPEEEVVVDLPPPLAVEVACAEVERGDRVHVAVDALSLRLGRIIEAARAAAGDPREQERVVMVLPAEEVLVVVEREGEPHLVARRAELRVLDDGLEERLLVHLGLGLDQRVVHPLQQRALAGGERVVLGLLDRVVGVAPGAVDLRDRVADGAGDPGLAALRVHVVVVRVVELAREERDRVVTPRAPAGGLRVAVAFHGDAPGLAHAGQVRLVVERAEVVRGVEPALVGVLVALQAVIIHHQGLGGDELAGGRDRLGRVEVLLALLGPPDAERPGVLRVQEGHQHHEARHDAPPDPQPLPADARAGQAVLHIEPDRQQGRHDVQPVAHRADGRVADLEPLEPVEPDEDQPREADHDRAEEQGEPEPHGRLVRPLPRRDQVREAEDEERDEDGESEDEVEDEHQVGKERLMCRPLPPRQGGEAGEVDTVRPEQGEPAEDDPQQGSQPTADGRRVDPAAAVLHGTGAGRHQELRDVEAAIGAWASAGWERVRLIT